MRRLLYTILLTAGIAPCATYSYSIYNPSDTPVSQSVLTGWSSNGSTNGSIACGGQNGCPLYSTSAGSLIYTNTGGASAYEVAVNLDSQFVISGGAAQLYLHASNNALRSSTGSSDQGTFDAVVLSNPTCATDGSCAINFAFYERTTSSTTLLASTVVPYLASARVRAVAYGTTVGVLVNSTFYSFTSGLSGGFPGVGVATNSSGVIDSFQIGPQCTTIPAPIPTSNIVFSAYPNSVSMMVLIRVPALLPRVTLLVPPLTRRRRRTDVSRNSKTDR